MFLKYDLDNQPKKKQQKTNKQTKRTGVRVSDKC